MELAVTVDANDKFEVITPAMMRKFGMIENGRMV